MGTLLECRRGVLVGCGEPISLIRPNVVVGLAVLAKQLLMCQAKLIMQMPQNLGGALEIVVFADELEGIV